MIKLIKILSEAETNKCPAPTQNIELNLKNRQIAIEKLLGYQSFMKSKIFELNENELFNWTQKQCYLVLANMMNAAAALKIDATPMEGFSPAAVNELLKLDELNLNATLIITLGYRHIEDTNQHLKKIRKPISELLITLE